jgi:hypothetical protein
MSVHKYTSWGRTRRPKNITGKDGTQVIGTSIAALTALDIANTGSNASPSNGVYKTENQRYLHLHASGSSSGCNNVYTYLYASQQWSELVVLDPGASDTLVPVSCGANQTRIVDIAGADLIAFATGSGGLYAAFSTF